MSHQFEKCCATSDKLRVQYITAWACTQPAALTPGWPRTDVSRPQLEYTAGLSVAHLPKYVICCLEHRAFGESTTSNSWCQTGPDCRQKQQPGPGPEFFRSINGPCLCVAKFIVLPVLCFGHPGGLDHICDINIICPKLCVAKFIVLPVLCFGHPGGLDHICDINTSINGPRLCVAKFVVLPGLCFGHPGGLDHICDVNTSINGPRLCVAKFVVLTVLCFGHPGGLDHIYHINTSINDCILCVANFIIWPVLCLDT